MFLYDLEV